MKVKIAQKTIWEVEHWRGEKLLSRSIDKNIVPDQMVNHCLDVIWNGATQFPTWYIGLTNGTYTPQASDTYATPGISEASSYTGDRKVWSKGSAASKQVQYSAAASFTLNGNDSTIYGAFLCNVATPGDTAAANGILGPSAKFTTEKTGIENGDVLKVRVTSTGADDGV